MLLSEWSKHMDIKLYESLNQEQRQENCRQYLEENYINDYEDDNKPIMREKMNDNLDTYHWKCEDIDNFLVGCGDKGGRIKRSVKNVVRKRRIQRKAKSVGRKLINKRSVKKRK